MTIFLSTASVARFGLPRFNSLTAAEHDREALGGIGLGELLSRYQTSQRSWEAEGGKRMSERSQVNTHAENSCVLAGQ